MAKFPSEYRLHTPEEFDTVFTKGDLRASVRHLRCLARSSDREHARLGMVVSKRNVPKAVERNRIKRIIRESFRHNCSTLPNCDIVVVCRPGLTGVSSSALASGLNDLWRQLRDSVA